MLPLDLIERLDRQAAEMMPPRDFPLVLRDEWRADKPNPRLGRLRALAWLRTRTTRTTHASRALGTDGRRMTDTEEGVRAMFATVTDIPPVASVRHVAPGVWAVMFGDGTTATAFPLEGRWEDDGDGQSAIPQSASETGGASE